MHTSARSDYLRCSRTTSRTSRTAVYGAVRTVVWQGGGGGGGRPPPQPSFFFFCSPFHPLLHTPRPPAAPPPETPAPHGSAPAAWDRSAGSCAPRATLSPSPRATVPARSPARRT